MAPSLNTALWVSLTFIIDKELWKINFVLLTYLSTNLSGDSGTTPIVSAIKDELQKFQRPRTPNMQGISIINDPELLATEEDNTSKIESNSKVFGGPT